MPVNPYEIAPLGRTSLKIPRLGLGMVSLAGMYEAVADETAHVTLDHAWGMGIRYYDAAPVYGYGLGETRMGRLLQAKPRGEFVVSTKVGRLLYPLEEVLADPSLDRDWQRLGSITGIDASDKVQGEDLNDWYFRGVPDVRPVYDYSRDGVMRSVEESLERTGLDRFDILWIHDPDSHWEQAIGGAFPALADLRSQGVVTAIGAGMNQAEMLARFAREGDFDAFMCAGRYTLLDQPALDELLPVCLEKNIAIVIGGAMNSGLLANPSPDSHFDYGPAPKAWLDKALAIKAVCERHRVPLRAAALQFGFGHPAVVAVVAGVRKISHLEDTVAMMQVPIPDDLWEELKAEGLLPSEAPTPRLELVAGSGN
ncbi:MAG TPA: aldo/keto reductase [Vicinamibacterales bacterium]